MPRLLLSSIASPASPHFQFDLAIAIDQLKISPIRGHEACSVKAGGIGAEFQPTLEA